MRDIGKILSETDALRFSSYLKRKGVLHTCEASFETPSQYVSYEVWVHDEDRLDEAKKAFETFSQNPADPAFDIPITEQMSEEETAVDPKPAVEVSSTKRRLSYFTKLIIALCVFIFFINEAQEIPLLKEGTPESILPFTPIQVSCLYDLPPFFEQLTQLMQKHKPLPNQQPQALGPEIQAELSVLPHTAYWKGFYDWFILKMTTNDSSEAEGELFIKIRQGEVWRLISPCILHGGLLHILFNMIWVWVLCRPVEQRIGFFRTFLFSLAIAIGSNTAQYLMGGPFFLGYSGVVMGLAGFIWSRQQKAPWEGYPIQRSTLLFLTLFVLAMFALQFAIFILQLFSDVQFPLNIANTAHISGGIFGVLLGRLKFFSWKVVR
jgi:GlpG protein